MPACTCTSQRLKYICFRSNKVALQQKLLQKQESPYGKAYRIYGELHVDYKERRYLLILWKAKRAASKDWRIGQFNVLGDVI